jgi:hypothetical protein
MLDCRPLIQIDFPEAARATFLDSAEVVFAMGIIVFGEGVERADLLQKGPALIGRHGFDAGGDHDGAADEGTAESVIQFADAVGFGRGDAGHGSAS